MPYAPIRAFPIQSTKLPKCGTLTLNTFDLNGPEGHRRPSVKNIPLFNYGYENRLHDDEE